MNIRQWFCRHKWVKHSETILPSAFEQVARTGGIKRFNEASGIPMWTFRKKFILTFMCEKCKKIKQFVQTNPSEDYELEEEKGFKNE